MIVIMKTNGRYGPKRLHDQLALAGCLPAQGATCRARGQGAGQSRTCRPGAGYRRGSGGLQTLPEGGVQLPDDELDECRERGGGHRVQDRLHVGTPFIR